MEDPRKLVQMKKQLLTEIQQDILEPGDKLSAYAEARDRGVSETTLRKALESLADDGWVIRPVCNGRSYHVAS